VAGGDVLTVSVLARPRRGQHMKALANLRLRCSFPRSHSDNLRLPAR
jgi:hypothetical protein